MTVQLPEPRNLRLLARIGKRLAGDQWPRVEKKTTGDGASADVLDMLAYAWTRVSAERKQVYKDVKEMDETVEEVATALDMLAANATSSEAGNDEAFHITFPGKEVSRNLRKLIDRTVEATLWREKAYAIAREALLYGDGFYQYVMDSHLNVVRLMYMPPRSMVRNEDDQGLLAMGHEQGTWSFEQYYPDTQKLIAGFFPWQIEHLRWGRSGESRYGRSLLFTSRTAWRKMQAMEEALVINWLTRAFARLLFILDVTGKSPKEAEEAIKNFKLNLQTRKVAKDVKGVEHLSIVRDVYLGRSYHEMGGKAVEGLTDAKVLDTTSSAFTQLDPIQYYRGKILMSLRTPPAYLGLEENINAKATLTQEDRRYARMLRSVQALLTSGIKHTIDLQLALHGIDPRGVPYVIEWPSASWMDAIDDSQAQASYAQADAQFSALGVVDKQFIATHHLHMTQSEFEAVQERLVKEAEAVAEVQDAAGATGPTGPQQKQGKENDNAVQ